MARNASATDKDRLLADLTEPQAAAVVHQDGPLLVLAGAGCGKTRVITRRAAFLADTVARSDEILAITFTNKAACEMRERIERLGVAPGMTVCTFHALCARMLRSYHQQAHVPDDFTIFDAADQRKVLAQAIADAGLSTDNWKPAHVQTVISNAKNAMITSVKFADSAGDWSQRSIAAVYAAYVQLLDAQHGLDFDDLLLKWALVLENDADLRQRIQRRFRYLLIDEYQDTNLAQYHIARLMAGEARNICATGDPDQSIYGWRGADIRNILQFEEDFPDTAVVRLEQNYRSTARILAAAGALISHNVHRKEKSLWTEGDEGVRVRIVETEDGQQEAQQIADEILARRSAGQDLSGTVVFYRINAMSRACEEAFIKSGIAYEVARGTEFYNRKEIKNILAYARVLANPFDAVSLTRIINTPARGIGSTTVNRIINHATENGQPLIDVVRQPAQVRSLRKAAIEKLIGFAQLLDMLATAIDDHPAQGLERVISHSGLRAELLKTAEFDPEPMANADELLNAATAFGDSEPQATLRDWLQYASLLGDADVLEDAGGKVTLMTLHAAKGLEFPCVYMIGLEEGMLPFRRDADDDFDVEEERRLCFVGMTRAQAELTMMHGRYRMIRGISERKVASRFLDELDDDSIERIDRTASSAQTPRRRPGFDDDLDADKAQWRTGTLVRHDTFGLGRIMHMHRNGRQVLMKVQFQDGTERTYTMGFAPLEHVPFDEAPEA